MTVLSTLVAVCVFVAAGWARLEAVIAAHYKIRETRLDWVSKPAAIIAEKMTYQKALMRIQKPGSETGYKSTRSDTQVWLVVFKGGWTLTELLGTVSAPFSKCVYALINAADGMGMRSGLLACEQFNLER